MEIKSHEQVGEIIKEMVQHENELYQRNCIGGNRKLYKWFLVKRNGAISEVSKGMSDKLETIYNGIEK
jgi:hypothetical protein